MAIYRYTAFGATSGARLAELPLRDVTYARVLNGAGEMRATLPLGQPAAYFGGDGMVTHSTADVAWIGATAPARAILIAERDGVIVWAGIIWTRRWSEASRSFELAGLDLWSYLRHRYIASTPSWSGVATDQCVIARSAVAATQTGPGNIGIATGTETSTTTRTLVVNGYERRTVADVVEDLARMDGGLDFTVDATWSGTTPAYTFRVGTPLGRATGSGLVFELGRNIVSLSWPEDGTKTASVVTAQGAGDGEAMLLATASRSDAWAVGFPQLDAVVAAKQTGDGTALAAVAAGAVSTMWQPAELPEITVRGDLEPKVGSWQCGDVCTVRIPAGMSPRFPAGSESQWRIQAWSCTPGNEGQETVTLTLAPPL